MSRCTLKRFLWTAAVVAALGLAAPLMAKPPDLPIHTEQTVTPEVLPDSEWDGVSSLPSPFKPTLPPFMAHLSPTQRQHFASTLLFGAHPLLSLVPTDRIVDLACDHPACPVAEVEADAIVVWAGAREGAGVKCEIVPMPRDVHGTIEIGIGFNLNGAPTYKFLVTEFSPGGACRKDETLSGCMNTLLRALMRDCCDSPKPVEGGVEESTIDGPHLPKTHKPGDLDPLSMSCPFMHSPRHEDFTTSSVLHAPSVLENLQKLTEANELREKGRRLAEDGFPTAAKECFEKAMHLCPGSPLCKDIAGSAAAAGCEEMEEVYLDHVPLFCGGANVATVPGARVMADGLMKACHQALLTGRYEHALDLARQAIALDAVHARGDVVVFKLHRLANAHDAGCCEKNGCPGDCCKDCPECPDCQKPKSEIGRMPQTREIVIIGNVKSGPRHDFPATVTVPSGITINRVSCPSPWVIFPQTLPAVDPQMVKAFEDIQRCLDDEQQEELLHQKAIAKPYRETNNTPAGVGKKE